MVDMQTLQTISISIASAGVFVAAVYYVLQLRHQTKIRKSDAFWRVYQSFNSKEFLEASFKVLNLEFDDYDDFLKKHGPPFADSPVAVALALVGNMYEGAGQLLFKGLTDYETISDIPIGMTWKKMKPIIEGARKQYNFPALFTFFEYLYKEGKKREQRLASKTA